LQVVFCPGLLCDASIWAAQVEALRPFADVAVADFSQLASLEDMARSALALREGKLVVIGHSMGARAALEMVRLAPERIERVAFLDTGTHPRREGEEAARQVLVDLAYQQGIAPFQGAVDFSWHLIDTLVENRFDPMICQEIEVDHGIQVPMELFWGRPDVWPVKVVPIFVNVIQYPIPLPSRCYEMGRVLRKAIDSYDSDECIVILGTGGLSHQLQGARAGFVNPEADQAFLRDIATDPDKLAAMSREQYVEMFGSEGAELMMWLVMRGAMDRDVVVRHKHYFVPASMTGAGMIVMENAASAAREAA